MNPAPLFEGGFSFPHRNGTGGLSETTLFLQEAEHINSPWGDGMAAISFTFYEEELHALELEIMLAVNERLYRRQLISEDTYNQAKTAILGS